MIRRNRDGFALVVPVGPGDMELSRCHDLLDSLFAYEPAIRLAVLIDSEMGSRALVPQRFLNGGCRFITLNAPFHNQGEALLGRLSAGILTALRAIHQAGPFEFVLRMDTDALVIGPFRDAVLDRLAARPEAGILGTLGSTCRREAPYFGCEKTATSDVFEALQAAAESEFTAIRSHARMAVENGYAGKEYCQGGVYVLSFELLTGLFALRSPIRPEDWVPLAVPEDVMIGMYARTVGLQSVDCSLPGGPFANHHSGLAYSPPDLVARGCSLIHSVRDDPGYSEGEIRSYFLSRRRASVIRGSKYSSKALSV